MGGCSGQFYGEFGVGEVEAGINTKVEGFYCHIEERKRLIHIIIQHPPTKSNLALTKKRRILEQTSPALPLTLTSKPYPKITYIIKNKTKPIKLILTSLTNNPQITSIKC